MLATLSISKEYHHKTTTNNAYNLGDNMSDDPNNNNHLIRTDSKVGKLVKGKLLRYARRRRLLCKNGMYLAIDKNGVHGTKDPNNPYAEIQVLSIGSDMLALWGTRAGLYLAVDTESGKIYTTSEEGKHCVFIETFTKDFNNIFESYKSVYDNQAKYIALNSQNKLAMTDHNEAKPDRNGKFIWELVDK
ncbi:fibroblast growth factor 1-like [Clytia hemisphaerica]|uniref:Fibroblast growth factor n=1 Tax=Clytia hemisphaerica TaxID=252671 RepID=A0A7M5UEG5_9CNID